MNYLICYFYLRDITIIKIDYVVNDNNDLRNKNIKNWFESNDKLLKHDDNDDDNNNKIVKKNFTKKKIEKM